MKRFLSAALVLSLLGSSAAVAAPYGGHGNFGNHGGYGGGYRHGGGNNGALLAGVGLFALAAIIATSHNDERQDAYYDRGYDYRDAPPPPPPGYGYDNGYNGR